MSKYFLNIYETHWQRHLKEPCRNGSTYMLILTWVNTMKRKWVKVPRKLSVNALIMLFSMKPLYLLKVKITPGVNNFL